MEAYLVVLLLRDRTLALAIKISSVITIGTAETRTQNLKILTFSLLLLNSLSYLTIVVYYRILIHKEVLQNFL